MWTYTSFAGVNLPTNAPSHDISAGPAASRMVSIAGGAQWDALGANEAIRGPKTATCRCMIVAASTAAADAIYDDWEALCLTRGTLVRTRGDGSTTQWCTARLVSVQANRTAQTQRHLPVTLDFQIVSGCWYGASLQTTTKNNCANGVNNLPTISYGGNKNQRNVTITITATGNSITNTTVQNLTTGHTWGFSGTIPAGQSLVVNCGAKSVLLNGANAYASFVKPTTKADWFMLSPGNNSVRVTLTTAGGVAHVASVAYYEAFG